MGSKSTQCPFQKFVDIEQSSRGGAITDLEESITITITLLLLEEIEYNYNYFIFFVAINQFRPTSQSVSLIINTKEEVTRDILEFRKWITNVHNLL